MRVSLVPGLIPAGSATYVHPLDPSSLPGAVLSVAALPVAAASGYLLLLTVLSRRRRPPPASTPSTRIDVVVPAHDEENGIAATVASLLATDYPPALRRVVVVADNCSDATADRAREAGARVLVRVDPERRGKGYALALAFDRSIADGFAEAVAVVDADTVVSPGFLRACALRVAGGAGAVQVHYGVRNPDASWRTRLLAISFALFHEVRSLARERLRCSAGLRGNGMCFTTRLLREVPYQAFSVVEDVEYGIRLGLAGHRVHYAGEAAVLGEMPSGAAASRSQRRRWEGGRMRMARQHALELLRLGVVRRDRVLLDLGLDLLVPPLSYLGAAAAGGMLVVVLASALRGRWVLPAAWLWGASLAAIAVHVARGWWRSGTGWRGLRALGWAPVYLVWKLGVAISRPDRPKGEWVRTSREPGPPSAGGPGAPIP